MAYSVEFGPTAREQLARLDLKRQRRIIQQIEFEAQNAAPEGDKQRRLRRLRVEDQRLVILELHGQSQMLVLKIAGNEDLRRWIETES